MQFNSPCLTSRMPSDLAAPGVLKVTVDPVSFIQSHLTGTLPRSTSAFSTVAPDLWFVALPDLWFVGI